MSVCTCPIVGIDGIESFQQKHKVQEFLRMLDSEGVLARADWSLLSISDMALAGNSLQTITDAVPFRGGPCNRTMKCCGVCVRQCYTRCIQDCMHRLYMWKKLVENTPPMERERLPLSIRLIVKQKFESHKHLSWVIGEILSQKTNSKLKEYMSYADLRPEENPYKIDYSPQVDIDPATGKRRVDIRSGELCFVEWPQSGLCPYCLPSVTIDGRTARAAASRLDQDVPEVH